MTQKNTTKPEPTRTLPRKRISLHKRIELKRKSRHWCQDQINKTRERGFNIVNFTCAQTLMEAQADLNKDLITLNKEIYDYCYSQR